MLGVLRGGTEHQGGEDDEQSGGNEINSNELMTFDSVLKRAALMGLNIQSDEFWELRPDYFIIMSDAYEIREQQRWLPFRRLMSVIVSVNGGKVEEADFINLSHFDKPKNIKNYKVPSYEEAMAFTNELIKNGNLKA